MTKAISFGGDYRVAPADYASQGNAILGIRDSGKSYTATYIAERLLEAGVPITVFDPIGVWKWLRVPAATGSGKRGYEVVVAGGQDGDLPLTPSTTAAIVRAAMQDGVSLVLDLYSMQLSKADWKAIVEQGVKTMLYENGKHGLRHVFIEEAAEFAPQRIGPDQGRVYAEVEKLARMGGNALLGYTLINQRAEEVNKAVLELCDCLFLHRQKGRNSLTALSKWLDFSDRETSSAVIGTLPTLGQGQCWVWGAGAERPVQIKVPAKNSYHPDRRAMRASPKEYKAVDVSAFIAQLSTSLTEVIEQAKANDPSALKRQIADLRRQLDTAGKADPESARKIRDLETARLVADGKLEALRKNHEELRLKHNELLERVRSAVATLGGSPLATRITGSTSTKPAPYSYTVDADAEPNKWHTVKQDPRPARPRQTTRQAVEGGALSKAERLVLSVLAQYPEGRTKSQTAILAGYAVNGGGFNNAISRLRTLGYLSGSKEQLQITDAGVTGLGDVEPLPSGQALIDYWMRNPALGKAERQVLQALVEAYPHRLDKPALAERAGYEANGGGFNNAVSRLRTLELIHGRGELQASKNLFE